MYMCDLVRFYNDFLKLTASQAVYMYKCAK